MKTDTQDKHFAFRVNAQNNNQSPVIVSSGCCLYEECNKNPCDQFGQGTVCTEMASCQSNKCNKDYATAIASQRPTRPSKACKVLFDCLVLALAAMACSYYFIL